MADNTSIEWTGATWNIVTGCSVVSPGCTNCYAMRLAGTRLRNHFSREGLTTPSKAGPVWNGQTRVNWEWIDQPLSWARARDIFVCAHGDLFHESVSWQDIATIYGVMIAAHHLRGHRFQVLTKRASRARELLNRQDFWDVANGDAEAIVMERVDPLDRRNGDARATLDDYGPENPPPGIWLGVSVEDQVRALSRIPDLLATPAVVRWLSCEPLLGAIYLTDIADGGSTVLNPECWGDCDCSRLYGYDAGCRRHGGDGMLTRKIDWVVVGGESGPGARPMHPDWARQIRDDCDAAGVPFFFKQWGAWASVSEVEGAGPHHHFDDGATVRRVGKKAAGRTLDGVIHNAMPEVAHG